MLNRLLQRFNLPRRSAAPLVSCTADRVAVRAPEIFSAFAVEAVRRFTCQVFTLAEVCQLEVDLASGVGTIHFDKGANLASCLSRLSEQLRLACDPPQFEMPAWRPVAGVQRLTISRQRELVSSWQIVEQAGLADDVPELGGGLRRLTYLSLAAASFGVAVVGVVLPGIPTVPFLLVSSYFLVRSSPSLHRRLLDSRIFGPMLRDWQRYHGLRRSAKLSAVALLVVVVVASALLAGLTFPLVVVVVLLAMVGLWMIWRIPVIDGRRAEIPAFETHGQGLLGNL